MTNSQVQEFFATQKSRVKAYVQQCTDQAKPLVVDDQPEQNLGIDLSFTKLTDVESVESLLETMRQELHFTQQEKLLQIILQTEPGLVLRRYFSPVSCFGRTCFSLYLPMESLEAMFKVLTRYGHGKQAPSINLCMLYIHISSKKYVVLH